MPTSLLSTPPDDTAGGRRGQNAAAVLRALLDEGPTARSTIGRITGPSTAAARTGTDNRRSRLQVVAGIVQRDGRRCGDRCTGSRAPAATGCSRARRSRSPTPSRSGSPRGAADGFNVMPPYHPGGLEVFVETVVPILRERGLFRTEYSGRTLRDHFGLPRPENRFARGPAVAAG
ncbi:MAG TPA: hypothetical protein VKZ81_19465 [Pseudonocardia sp.]|jgi:hypothetical protein|uniref:hypothetical protein n=1 Tax=Pseudonocardia sp. TaxID=60912 RepID=UPI002B4B6AFA|nr:hypothetical protein [Pseudonocardia sp.]HLU57641.1 hypothetical protein [Pseudonocardia sp.]